MLEWANLRQFRCPYCGFDLQKTGEEIKCKSCRFHISEARFKSIAENRKQKPTTNIRIKWQNLIDARCPICSNFLTPSADGNHSYQKCISAECVFKITDSRVGEILNDKTHPANIFYKENQIYEITNQQ